jgi:hypothetical protein
MPRSLDDPALDSIDLSILKPSDTKPPRWMRRDRLAELSAMDEVLSRQQTRSYGPFHSLRHARSARSEFYFARSAYHTTFALDPERASRYKPLSFAILQHHAQWYIHIEFNSTPKLQEISTEDSP